MSGVIRELYGAFILFFYFLKWPIFVGVPLLYYQGLNSNWIVNIVWLACLLLIIKDFVLKIKSRK